MRIVIDHLSGSRRGQRQEFVGDDKVSFGRHPECSVSFDAHRDLDASTRHAELLVEDETVTLCDIGSSNGTFVDGDKITRLAIGQGSSVIVEFGSGGPQARIWVGNDELDPPPAEFARPAQSAVRIALAAAVVLILGFIVLQLLRAW